MGIFSSKKTITVSSTAYNMAGDEKDRPNFLKGTIFGSMIADSDSIADDIQTSYFDGPGMKQRQFFRWANRQNLSSMPITSIANTSDIDPLVVQNEIPVSPSPAGLILSVTYAEVSDGDFQPFIERWLLENHPDRVSEEWLGEFDPATDTFSVEFPNNDFFSFPNAGQYNVNSSYIVAKYVEYLDNLEQPVVEGTVSSSETLPNLTGFTQSSLVTSFTPVTLQRTRTTVYSFNNGDPDITHEDAVDADVSGQLSTDQEVWERIEYISGGINQEGERQIWNLTGTDYVTTGYTNTVVTQTDLGGGVIRTETATTTGEQVQPRWDQRYDTQFVTKGSVIGGDQIFIYELGTGNTTLDNLVSEADAAGFQEFFPFLPVRLDNQSITENQFSDVYEESSKAYKRAFQGKSFDDLITSVEDNEQIDDIDYAYVMFGASLNTEEMACRSYIYDFMSKMITYQASGSGDAMGNLQTQINAYNSALSALITWENTNWDSTAWGSIPNKPVLPKISPPPINTIKLKVAALDYDIRLEWIHIEENQYNGNFADSNNTPVMPDAREDDYILVNGPDFTWQERIGYSAFGGDQAQYETKTIPSMYIYWQVDSNTFRRLQVWGFQHQNYIYKGKSVKITSKEALNDTEESGFIIPLHYPTMSEMNIVDYTQMSTANTWILFNSYEVTKQRWYERGIFKILLVILIIVIAVVVFPGAFAAGGGILGGNLAVGAALGLTGTAALVAGVVANYIASMIISQILSAVGTALFGEKWGAVFAAIAGFAMGMAMTGTSLFSTEGIMKLGSAVANGYSGYVQGDITEMQEDLVDEQSDYEKEMERIQDLIDGLGGNDLNFNPMFLTDYGRSGNGSGSTGYLPETSDEYIRRTTMTGSDIVDITFSMVYDYVDVAKTLPRN